jgi:hypothetical protein
LPVIIFHCPLPGFHPISWLGVLLLLLVSILSHSLRLLSVLRRGKFLISSSACPRVLKAPKGNAWFDRQGCDHFSKISFPSKNSVIQWAMICFISFCFLITGHGSLFAPWLLSQFRHFFNTRPFICSFSAWKHCFFFS